MTALEDWIARQKAHAVAGLLRSISPAATKTRSGFGQTIVARKGAVVASPVLASYDPDPDYFFHWYRDSALAMQALWLVRADVPDARRHLQDHVRFSLDLMELDGRRMPPDWRARVEPDFVRFLRKDIEAAHGEAIRAETRVNADGTLDISDWPRPQNDGPALRVLALLRWGPQTEAEAALLRGDLCFVLDHALEPCFDIWEEEVGLHYYTQRVCEAALRGGSAWLAARDAELSARCRTQAGVLAKLLEDFWSPELGFVRSRKLQGAQSSKELDIAVILAANHAGTPPDRQLDATLQRLADLFRTTYPINQGVEDGPAMGRYAGDTYYSGGAYYFATLGAAEYCYRAGDRRRGDAFLETVRRFAPEDGRLPEQFDQKSGAPTSAKDLAWSHAAFLTCIEARTAGRRAIDGQAQAS